jgi:ribulose-phosphate 3-epimerase
MDTARLLADLRAAVPVISPSLLAADFANLEREIRRLEEAGARLFHLDIMDGHFVPNLSFGLPVVEAIRRVTRLPLDVHLMISEPGRYAKRYCDAGADLITFHIEAVPEPLALLDEIRGSGAAAGISLNPPTPLAALDGCLDHCDLVLVMSVMPGFGGQHFQSVALEKLRLLRERVRPEVLLSVDGGVKSDTIGVCAEAGADLFVVGTGLLGYPDYRRQFVELRAVAQGARGARVSRV